MVIEIPEIKQQPVSGQAANAPVEKREDSNHPSSFAPPAAGRPRYEYSTYGYTYQKEELYVKYQSKDGDVLELSYSSEKYAEYAAKVEGEGSPFEGERSKFFEKVQDFIDKQEQKLLDIIFKTLNGEPREGLLSLVNPDDVSEADPAEELGIPEYWNAENTSQRIVDFATSFFEVSGMSAEEFGEVAMGAIKKGIEMANEVLGELPGAVGRLIDQTQDMTIDKMQQWINEHTQMAQAA